MANDRWTRDDIETLIERDPRFAAGLVAYGGQRQVYRLQCTMPAGTITGNPTPASFQNPVTSNFAVYDMLATVELPEANVGSILGPTFQVDNEKMPGIDVQASVTAGMSGGLPYNVNQQFMPIQQMARMTTSPASFAPMASWGNLWIFPYASQLTINHLLTKVYPDGLGLPRITWALYTAFLGANFLQLSVDDAVAILKTRGFEVPPHVLERVRGTY